MKQFTALKKTHIRIHNCVSKSMEFPWMKTLLVLFSLWPFNETFAISTRFKLGMDMYQLTRIAGAQTLIRGWSQYNDLSY